MEVIEERYNDSQKKNSVVPLLFKQEVLPLLLERRLLLLLVPITYNRLELFVLVS